MSKYEPLAHFLDKRSSQIWQAKFMEIEQVLGFSLPNSAYRYPAWWANQDGKGHSQTAGWRRAGWRTGNIDLPGKRVTFERETKQQPPKFDTLLDRAKLVTGIGDAEGLIAKALEDFAAAEAIAFLNALGGTIPDFRAAPRDRPSL